MYSMLGGSRPIHSPQVEFEVKLEGAVTGRSLSALIVKSQPQLDQLQEIHVTL